MARKTFSTKRIQISRENSVMVGIIAGAAFLVIFSLVASKALLDQRAYQARVIAEKEVAKRQLQENLRAVEQLTESYKEFVGAPENVLGGNPTGRGDKDGDNAKIVLDALPSKYDFPALTTSLEKILTNPAYKIETIEGQDDELNQKDNASSPSPEVIEIPFEVAVTGSYPAVQDVVRVMERSIRPFNIQSLELSGNDAALRLTVNAITYYQPEKNLNITTKVVQ
jgi:hypothetical protein